MGLFLTLKQIVDMLYQFKILDVIMVVFAVALVVYRVVVILKQKKSEGLDITNINNLGTLLKKNIHIADCMVLVLGLLLFISFLRNTSATANFIKMESALLVYFLGRFYGEVVFEHGRKMAAASYVLIYINAVYFFYSLISYITGDELYFADVANIRNIKFLYYYKTDLAIAVLIGTVFIYKFSKIKWLRNITVFVVNPLFLYNTGARTGQVLYLVILFIIVLLEIKKIRDKKNDNNKDNDGQTANKRMNVILNGVFIMMAVVLFIAFILFKTTIINKCSYFELGLSEETLQMLDNKFHTREVMWWDTLHYMSNQPIITYIAGKDIDTMSFASHNAANRMSHSLFLTLFYGTGVVGTYVFGAFIYCITICWLNVKNMDARFCVMTTWILFLFYGFSVETFESTQFSWFPFIFAGAIVSIYLMNNKRCLKGGSH